MIDLIEEEKKQEFNQVEDPDETIIVCDTTENTRIEAIVVEKTKPRFYLARITDSKLIIDILASATDTNAL